MCVFSMIGMDLDVGVCVLMEKFFSGMRVLVLG